MTPLKQCLADALRAPAMDLPMYDHWIEDDANVIDSGKRFELNQSCFLIDLDFDNAAAVRKAERCGRGVGCDDATPVGPSRQLAETCGAVGADDEKLPISIFDIRLGCLEPPGRELASLFDQALHGAPDRCTASHQRA